jgi:hypothetical protein
MEPREKVVTHPDNIEARFLRILREFDAISGFEPMADGSHVVADSHRTSNLMAEHLISELSSSQ